VARHTPPAPTLATVKFAARVSGVAVALIVAALLAMVAVPGAHAGVWAQVSCVNPNGSAATSAGWTAFTTGDAYGAAANPACAPGTPMTASLGDGIPASVFTSAGLMYTPPPGSTLVGGSLQVALSAEGNGTDAAADAEIDEPAQMSSDARLRCSSGSHSCGSSATEYAGTFTVPRNLGGNLYVTAACNGSAGFACDNGGRAGNWASAQVSSAMLLLQNIATPSGRDPRGTLLHRIVHGTAGLKLDVFDPAGPGVYRIAVAFDGLVVHDAAPSRNHGACVPVGTDPVTGALEFDAAQPCPTSLSASLRIPTARVPDGSHTLIVSVTDAAGNTTTVLRRRDVTFNPELTPRPRGTPRVRFAIGWRWARTVTLLRTISASGVPHSGSVAVSCKGSRCPSLPSGATPVSKLTALRSRLRGISFHPGDRFLITVTEHHRTERIQLTIRRSAHPQARLLG
jgi:hypothetical protein